MGLVGAVPSPSTPAVLTSPILPEFDFAILA